jgi:hypothetical protein
MTTVVHCKGNKTSHADYVYIGRPSPWGNPFIIGRDGDRDQVITKFNNWINISKDPHAQWIRDNIEQLRGKTLGCWCKPHACHGDVYLDILEANKP